MELSLGAMGAFGVDVALLPLPVEVFYASHSVKPLSLSSFDPSIL